jgi:glycosyltransferase involved in cell wall biosynthesis
LEVGGAERMLSRLVQSEHSTRLENIVVALTGGGALAPQIVDAGVPVFSLGMRPGWPNPYALYHFVRLMRRLSPDVIQTWLYHADLAGLLALPFFKGRPLVWNLRCADLDPDDHSWMLRALRKLLAVSSRKPDVIVSNSIAGRLAHEQIGYRPRRWEIIPNGFDTEVFRPCPEFRDDVRRELGVPPGAVLVGVLARVHPMKDHGTFLRAAALVAAARRDVQFLLIGRDTNSTTSLRDLAGDLGIAENVHLLGERRDVPRLLAGLDILVSSSYSEAFPNAIAEAMACGVPCVVTDVGDSAAIVADTGSVVPPRDPAALAAGIVNLLAEGFSRMKARGAAARARIVSQYSLKAIAERYEALYMDVTHRDSARKVDLACAE